MKHPCRLASRKAGPQIFGSELLFWVSWLVLCFSVVFCLGFCSIFCFFRSRKCLGKNFFMSGLLFLGGCFFLFSRRRRLFVFFCFFKRESLGSNRTRPTRTLCSCSFSCLCPRRTGFISRFGRASLLSCVLSGCHSGPRAFWRFWILSVLGGAERKTIQNDKRHRTRHKKHNNKKKDCIFPLRGRGRASLHALSQNAGPPRKREAPTANTPERQTRKTPEPENERRHRGKKQNKHKKTGAGLGRGEVEDEEVRVKVAELVQGEETQGEPQTPRRGFGFPQRLRGREEKRKHGGDETNQTKRRGGTQTTTEHGSGPEGLKVPIKDNDPWENKIEH